MRSPTISARPALFLLLTLLATPMLSGCSSETAVSAEPETSKADGKNRPANHLAGETSPYLLQHVHNPVNWRPWGQEALELAKKENKLIFLSVGYSSCHWCHVMERESFMDEQIAAYLNEHYICIKVDREERPDIDDIYMQSLHVYNRLSGSGARGGWPMSMFLLPDAKPFFGGTYFPARDGDRGAAPGFLGIIKKVHEFYVKNPERLEQDAKTLTEFVKMQLERTGSAALTELKPSLADDTLKALADQYDKQHGGFGYSESNPGRPKFPEPSNLFFLRSRAEQEQAKEMLVGTLDQMAQGGIYDHLGGGFHRYSTDRFWRIPHFEKMLYDNGQLASVYAEAYQLTGDESYRRVVEGTLSFVLREMTSPDGGFYSALDADSEGEEGKFYRWTKEEFDRTLSQSEQDLFSSVYGVDGKPNFEGEYYVPQLDKTFAAIAKELEMSAAELEAKLAPIRGKLLAVRDKRPRPMTDTKILTSWNGLMIRGFADAGRILSQPKHIETAVRAAEFVLENLQDKDGRLFRTHSQGKAKLNAYLNDYAFLANGLIALHRATGDKRWLEAADHLTAKQVELFWDERRGGFFFTSDDHESLFARNKGLVDGAQPSGNSVSAENMVYLAQKLDKPDYRQRAEKTAKAAASLIEQAPAVAPRMSATLGELTGPK